MANVEFIAMLNAGREVWNSFQESRGASQIGNGDDIATLDLRMAELNNRDFSGFLFTHLDLSGASFMGSSLRGILFSAVDLTQADLRGVDLSDATFEIVSFDEAELSGANLERTWFRMGVSFRNARLNGANLAHCEAQFGNFEAADLSETSLVRANLKNTYFTEASLRDANLSWANLSRADLQGADLRGTRFDSTNLKNATIYRTIPNAPDLSGAFNIPSSVPKRYISLAAAPGGGGEGLYHDPPEEDSTAYRIRVSYVTDRVAGGERRSYGTRRSERLSFGTSTVSIPKAKRPKGELPRPAPWKLDFRENLTRHVVMLDADEETEGQFYQRLNSQEASNEQSAVLLFVHGYNVSFEDAVRRTAQIAYDLEFEGTPVLYSWASQGTLRGYPVDVANNEQTWNHLAQFICDLKSQVIHPVAHLICHSMGGRAVCQAAARLTAKCAHAELAFKNIIFAAPDVHVSSFRETLPALAQTAERLTLYFCPNDLPLRASRMFHRSPRAGETALLADGLDTIDASEVLSGLLRHSVFGERDVLSDISDLVENGTLPESRFGLEAIDSIDGKYFKIKR
jgi:esterase/lipase superfamily enzyme/uncharacterized protein YjbI with pentapeptide repeats